MDKRILRYLGITAMFVFAFFLFTNRDNSSYPYRSEVKSLTAEADYATDLFIDAYRAFETTASYEMDMLNKQVEMMQQFIDRYEAIEGDLPDYAAEDYEDLMLAMYEQQEIFMDIVTVAETGEPIPGELALALKKVVERRVLFEGRLGRY